MNYPTTPQEKLDRKIKTYKERLELYENDLIYKSYKDHDISFLEEHIPEKLASLNIDINDDMDFLEYRMRQCMKKGGEILDISHLDLTKLPNNIQKSIKYLFCANNRIENLGDISKFKSLKVLDISNNKLTNLDNLPENIVEIQCINNNLEKLDLSKYLKLKRLDCSHNKLKFIVPIKNLENFYLIIPAGIFEKYLKLNRLSVRIPPAYAPSSK